MANISFTLKYWQLLYAEEYSEEPLVAFLQRPL